MTLSVDNVKASSTPDTWDLPEIFAYSIAYGCWLALSTIAFLAVIVDTTFFQDRFGVMGYANANDPHVKMIIYLQVGLAAAAKVQHTDSSDISHMPSRHYRFMMVVRIDISSTNFRHPIARLVLPRPTILCSPGCICCCAGSLVDHSCFCNVG